MKKIYILISLLYSFPWTMEAQESDYFEDFKTYFELPRESVYLHLNKSTYVLGEDMWFKGYVYNRQKEQPFKQTSNVYIGIYDSLGRPLQKKLFRAREGFVQGNIAVDSTFSNGAYYIRASTNWMKNFNEDDSYVQKVHVYITSQDIVPTTEKISYDVQFLPEGGNLISGIPNTIGVKVTDQHGYGKKIVEGVVLDEKEIVVKRFKNSVLGLGKFEMVPYHDQDYRVQVTFANGKRETYALPKIYPEGINIHVQNTSKDRLTLILNTNTKTREKIGERGFDLLIHRDGAVKKLPIAFAKDRTNVSLLLKKELLQKGMNILTLLDDMGQPVLERLFFNTYGMDSPEVSLSYQKLKNDSLRIQLKVKDELGDLKNLSISVLPKNTLSYAHRDNILSTFHLKPYIRGFVENPGYYFNDLNAKKESELDLLLLTQGWSRYQWTNILNRPPEDEFEFEQGLRFDAVVKSKIRNGEKIRLEESKHHSPQFVNIFENKFTVVNYFPEREEQIKVALVRKYGGYRKPDLDLDLRVNTQIDTLKTLWADNVAFQLDAMEFLSNTNGLVIEDNTISLDEVTLVEKKKKNELSQTNVFVPKFLKDKVTEVTPEIAWNYPLFSDIIRTRGYTVREELSSGTGDARGNSRVQIFTRIPLTLFPAPKFLEPIIYLNDVRLTFFDVLYRFPTSQIESYYFERSGASEGSRGAGGVIRIYTRRDSEVTSVFAQDDIAKKWGSLQGAPSGKYYEYRAKHGFEKTKEFYTPKYKTYQDKAFENFGVVHWAPKVVTNTKGEASFKILDTDLRELSLFIEGMGQKGSLISKTKNLSIIR
ncbi:hypothetical protein [Spongiimicrobium salis]|uniref:hypothetical protein n=1 Tax=Spongiimicrobium salis TaxID=1667022 RepID=UPI00374D94FF